MHPEDTDATIDEIYEKEGKVIYDGKKGDVINQYVTFTSILDEQAAIANK